MMVVTAVISVIIGASFTYQRNQAYRVPAPSPAHATAIEIAKKAVFASGPGGDQATYEASLEDGTWSVLVERITGYDWQGHPQFTPGRHCLVLNGKDGKVLQVLRGQ